MIQAVCPPALDVATAHRAMDWEHPALVERYLQDHDEDRAGADACFHALKQFMGVCAAAPKQAHAPSQPIDDMWHTALLFTRDYADFCQRSFGRFIHHQPMSSPVSAEVYTATRTAASRIFGELDTRYWVPGLTAADCGGGSRCDHSLGADCGMCGSSMYIP